MGNIIKKIKRNILIVEDELINQEILKEILYKKYNILTANDGLDAIDKIKAFDKPISLILLDINMPNMNGFDFLKKIKEDDKYKKIPVIVLTCDGNSELKSLELGAIDFIKKPYNMPEVILARVNRIVELYEDKNIIDSSERDNVTEVYNKHIFKEYVLMLDEYNYDERMDLNVLNIDNFHIINELYGEEKANEILKFIALELKNVVKIYDGIVGRLEEEYFVLYHKHIDDYTNIVSDFDLRLEKKYGINGVRLKLGVYEVNDKKMLPDSRINKAKLVCDQISGNNKNFLIYNKNDQENSLFLEQLICDFNDSIKNKNFKVYYQPKYNIESSNYFISSSEALVRWIHPKYGLISPGVFIPLFEERGLIRILDRYVWEEAIKQVALWNKKFNKIIPVSINVSRVDLLDDSIIFILDDLVNKYNVDPNNIYLEITESAYNADINNICDIILRLKEKGFKIEIDDFGSGYSSLNTLATIPFDVLKLDMIFVRQMYNNEKTLKMVEIVSDIAKFLNVILIAEGVETKEQLEQLKKFGYHIIQGYYFSKPLTKEEFEEKLRIEYGNN